MAEAKKKVSKPKKKMDKEYRDELAKIFLRTEKRTPRNLVPRWRDLTVQKKISVVLSWVLFFSAVAMIVLVNLAHTSWPTSWLSYVDKIGENGYEQGGEAWFKVIQCLYMFFFIYGISKLVRTILSLVFMKANNKTVTIVRFINSTIRYLAAFVVLFAILAVLGVDMTTILASAGILALVIGLGAQTLIADIIAGLSIVFEEQFDVGDIIVVDGFRGVVYEIGLATTKVVDFSGNLKSIRNSGISTVINQSHDLSNAISYCSVDYTSDLAYVRKVVEEELLKEFKNAIPAIVGEPKYLGVSELEDSGIQLMFLAKTAEEDRFSTQRAMNEIAITVLTRNGIEIPFPQVVVSQRKTK